MADEFFEKRTSDLNDALHSNDLNQLGSEALRTRIKQEGLLQRLGLPVINLVKYTSTAILSMWYENKEKEE